MASDSLINFNKSQILRDRLDETKTSCLNKVCSKTSIFVLVLLWWITTFPSQTKPAEVDNDEKSREVLQLPLCSELNQGPILWVIPQGLRPAELCFPVFDLQEQTNKKISESIST